MKLTTAEIAALDDLIENISTAREAVEAALLDYVAVLERTRRLRDGIVTRLTKAFDKKSEKFRDSKAGDEWSHCISLIEDLDLDDPVPDLDHGERLEEILQEVDGDGYA